MILLNCENLCVGYEGKGVASGISFSVNQGDYLCVIGENGAGKSTLIKTILELQKPLSGKIERHYKKTELGYLPQQTVVQKDFPATVEEIVLSGFLGKIWFFYGKNEKQAARKNMERFGIENFAKKSFRELSGGQKQRVLLARAMCSAQKLLVLDEPVAGLDPKITEELYEFSKGINKEGLTIIMITHDMQAIKNASHILAIGSGQFFGTKEEFAKTEQGKYFLGETK